MGALEGANESVNLHFHKLLKQITCLDFYFFRLPHTYTHSYERK